MRHATVILAIAALAFASAALAGGEKDQGQGASTTDLKASDVNRHNAITTFNDMDANDNFELEKSEAAELSGLEKKFDSLDKDGNGALDYAEFRSLAQSEGERKQ